MSIITDHWFEDDPNYIKDGDDWVNISETFNAHQRPIKNSDTDKGKAVATKEDLYNDVDFLHKRIQSLEMEVANKAKLISDLTIKDTPCHLESVDDDFGTKKNYEGISRILSVLKQLYSENELEYGMKFLRDVVVLSATENYTINTEFLLALTERFDKNS